MALKKMHWIGIVAAFLVLLVDVLFFRSDERMFLFLIGISLGVVVMPFVISISMENKKEQKINDMFLEFTRNLAESVATGTPISKSIVNMRKKNYGVLNPHIAKLANQIELGISVEHSLYTFAYDVDNPVIKRAVALISEAERAGGEIDYILESTAKSISEVETLKKERKSAIYNLVVQGYIIFFIFIGIILVMEYKIIPLTSGIGSVGGGFTGDISSFDRGVDLDEEKEFDAEIFTRPFLFLLVTQGFFIGLAIGKLTEGTIKAGLKHSFVMVAAAFLISSGSRLFLTGSGSEDVEALVLSLLFS